MADSPEQHLAEAAYETVEAPVEKTAENIAATLSQIGEAIADGLVHKLEKKEQEMDHPQPPEPEPLSPAEAAPPEESGKEVEQEAKKEVPPPIQPGEAEAPDQGEALEQKEAQAKRQMEELKEAA